MWDQLMKPSSLMCVLLIAAPCFGRKDTTPDRDVIEYAESIRASRLHGTLPSQRLEDWLLSGPPHVEKAEWYVSAGCDLKATGPEPKEGYPLCVRVAFARGALSGFALIRVGTTRKGIEGLPRFEHASMTTERLLTRGQHRSTRDLSHLVPLMAEVDRADRELQRAR